MAGTFLLIKGIAGKSRQEQRSGHFDVAFWKLEAHLPVDIDSSKGSLTTGQSELSDLTCGVICDTSVVRLMTSCLCGRHFDSARLVVTKDIKKGAGGKVAVEFLVLDMNDVLVSAVGLGGVSRQDAHLAISLKFARYTMRYDLYDEKGNRVVTDTDGYDLPRHTGYA